MAHVSVIIPTHNRKQMVVDAVSSAVEQTYRQREVIVVDDGSTDGSAEHLADRFGTQVKIICQENQGVSAARNRGIKAGQGPWYAFLDSDDRWHKEKLERQMNYMQRHTQFLVCHTDEVWFRNGKRLNPREIHRKAGGNQFSRSVELCCISISTSIVHDRLFAELDLFDEKLAVCEDYDLWLRVTARYPVLYLPEKLTLKEGGHADQLSSRYWGMDRFRITALEKQLAAGHLNLEQQALVLAAIERKAKILAKGAAKRDARERMALYQQKAGSAASQRKKLSAKSI